MYMSAKSSQVYGSLVQPTEGGSQSVMRGLKKIELCPSLPRMMAPRATWPCSELSHGACTGDATPRGATTAAAQALSLAPSSEPALILQGLTGTLPLLC